MMKIDSKGTFIVAAVLLCCFPVFTQASPRKKSLILSTSIVSREHTRDNVVDMKLRLRFTNAGNCPLILYKPSILLTEIGVFEDVEHPTLDTFAEASARSYVPHPYSYIPYEEIVKRRPNKDLIIIAPGKAYEMKESVGAQVRSRNRKQADGANDDRYLLTIKVSTWDASKQELAARLRRKWQRLGILWSEVIESEPIVFTVEREQTNGK
jgi:hypothetical protein